MIRKKPLFVLAVFVNTKSYVENNIELIYSNGNSEL